MIAASGFNDVVRIYTSTQRDGIASIWPISAPTSAKELPEPFDQGLHASAIRLRLSAGAARLRLGEDPTRVLADHPRKQSKDG